ncbi:rubrerythrin-like domain-containing protein [Halosolutus amylolyticus]|uniref:Rubrerythrin-like domain-containing protein n=1 Tax=Halosolutus amylolyticus TaxID=2932267 RepID=A0ABD5PSS9_9EURY
MRPSEQRSEPGLYECFECGKRVREGESRVCSCGGSLRHRRPEEQ